MGYAMSYAYREDSEKEDIVSYMKIHSRICD
jgi:hypothetical protein